MGRALGEPEHIRREQDSKPVGAARACRTPSWKPASRQLGEDIIGSTSRANCGKPPAAPAKPKPESTDELELTRSASG